MATPPDKVELRGELDRDIVDVIDAVSVAKGRTRMGQVSVILAEWAAEQRRISNVIQNVTRVNPAAPDSDRS